MSPADPKLLPVTGVQTKSLTPVKHIGKSPRPNSPCDEVSAVLERFCASQPYHLILINLQGEVVYLSPYLLNLFHIADPAVILGKVNLFDEVLRVTPCSIIASLCGWQCAGKRPSSPISPPQSKR